MTRTQRIRAIRCVILPCSLFPLFPCAILLAQKPNPSQGPPVLATVAPNGGPRGTALELALSGPNLGDAVAVGASLTTAVRIVTDATPGKDSTNFHAALDLPADAPLGFHRLWVAT